MHTSLLLWFPLHLYHRGIDPFSNLCINYASMRAPVWVCGIIGLPKCRQLIVSHLLVPLSDPKEKSCIKIIINTFSQCNARKVFFIVGCTACSNEPAKSETRS